MFTNTQNDFPRRQPFPSRSDVPFPMAGTTSQNAMAGNRHPLVSPRQRRMPRSSSTARVPSRLIQSIVIDPDGNQLERSANDPYRAPAPPGITHYGCPLLGAHGRNADSTHMGIVVYADTASPLAQPDSPPRSPEPPPQPPPSPTSPSFYLYSRPFYPNPPAPHSYSAPEPQLSYPSSPSSPSSSSSDSIPDSPPSSQSFIPPPVVPAPSSAIAPVAGSSRSSTSAPVAGSSRTAFPRLQPPFGAWEAPVELDVPSRETSADQNIRSREESVGSDVRSREGSVESTFAPSTVFLSPASPPPTSRWMYPPSSFRASRRAAPRGLPSVRAFVPANPPVSVSSPSSPPIDTPAPPVPSQVELPASRQPDESSVGSTQAPPVPPAEKTAWDFLLRPLVDRPPETYSTHVVAPPALPRRRSRSARLSVRFDLTDSPQRTAPLRRIAPPRRSAPSRRTVSATASLSAVSTTSTAGSPPRRRTSLQLASSYVSRLPQLSPDLPPSTSLLDSPNAPPRYSLASRERRISPRLALSMSQSPSMSMPAANPLPSPSGLPSAVRPRPSASGPLLPIRVTSPAPSPPPSPLAHRSPSVSPALTLASSAPARQSSPSPASLLQEASSGQALVEPRASHIEESVQNTARPRPNRPIGSGYPTRSKRQRDVQAVADPAPHRVGEDLQDPKGKRKAPAKPSTSRSKKPVALERAPPQTSTSRSRKTTKESSRVTKEEEAPAEPLLVRRKVGRPSTKVKGKAATQKTEAERSKPSTSRSVEDGAPVGNGQGPSTVSRYFTRSKRKRDPEGPAETAPEPESQSSKPKTKKPKGKKKK